MRHDTCPDGTYYLLKGSSKELTLELGSEWWTDTNKWNGEEHCKKNGIAWEKH